MSVDNSSWDGPAAMSRAAQSDDPAAAYEAICAGRRDGDPSVQATWALPHHQNPGDPPNATGVRNSLSRLPQTDGLTNAEAAQRHLEAHLEQIRQAEASADTAPITASSDVTATVTQPAATDLSRIDGSASIEPKGEVITLDLAMELQTLSVPERRLGLRIVPYDTIAVHPKYGALMFQQGAFGQVEPRAVRLRMDHVDPPTGLGLSFAEKPDGAYMDFQLSKTQRADEQLTLAKDGVSRGASVGFAETAPPQVKRINGQNVTVYGPGSVALAEVSTTWQPTFPDAGVLYALHQAGEKGEGPMTAEVQEAPAGGAIVDYDKLTAAIVAANASGERDEKIDRMLSKLDDFVEVQRAQFTVPQGEKVKPKLEDWAFVTLKRLSGEHISPSVIKELALDDVVTTEQPGLVPNVLQPDYDDVINQDRPFLNSTREIRPPATGTSLILPILVTRAVAGTQAGNAEKGALTTTAPKVGTGTFAYKPIFGGADISIQMIQRADRSFMDLLTGELGEAYALDAESKAIDALLAGYTDSGSNAHTPVDGGVLDPEDPNFGEAWENSILASKRAPDHIWMSAAAVGAFIDAKAPMTNAPLYSNLAAAFTAASGPGGRLSGLIPVYVPALDSKAVDVIVGPGRGFVWAEDPAMNLQADVPSIAGRDVALVGGIFPAPRYADAFTTYTIAS